MVLIGKSQLRVFLQTIKSLVVGIFAPDQFDKLDGAKKTVLKILRRPTDERVDIPKTVWIYWDSHILPNYIKNIIDHNRLINPNHEFILLNKDSYLDYIPDIKVTSEMPVANKTDVIRLALLYKYGGIWLDATVILQENLDWVHEESARYGYDIVAYYRDKETINFDFPIIESWFMASPAHSPFIENWLNELKNIAIYGSEVFYERIKNREDFLEIKQNIPNPEYLLIYLAGQISYRQYPEYNAFLRRAEDSALLMEQFYNNNYKMNYALCRLRSPLDKMSLVKLCSGDRMFVQSYIDLGLVSEKSLIGFFMRRRNLKK